MNLTGRDFLTLKDFTPEEILYLIDLSAKLKDMKKKGIVEQPLRGKNVALIFEKTSTRTRCSFEVAAHDLGMGVTYLDPQGSQIGKKESIADTARVLCTMFEGIEYRGFEQTIVEELAKYSSVPVWNGLTNEYHPTQMLADMYELAEKHQAQLVVCGFYIDTYCGQNHLSEKICVDDRVFTDAKDFREEAYRYFDRNMLYTPWNKLYRMDVIRQYGLYFPKTLWDDFPFNLSYLDHVESVVFSTNAYYHFIRARAESETAAYRADMYEKREEEQGWMEELFRSWGVTNAATQEMVARRYIERMVGCITNVTSSKCTLSGKEQRAEIRKMLHNPRVDKALALAKPRSGYMKVMLLPIRWKNVTLAWMESSVITFVKEHNGKLFARMKAGR